MKIGILSDTHSVFDNAIRIALKDCDEIWHAGDLGNVKILDALKSWKPLRAVYGNIDDKETRLSVPEKLCFEAGQLKVLMMHIGGYPPKYNRLATAELQSHNPDVFVCGHSHILKIMRDDERQLLYINPGAAGNFGFHKVRTVVLMEINDSGITKLQVLELGARGVIP